MGSPPSQDNSSVFKKILNRFLNLHIATKVMLGYIFLSTLLIVVSVFALSNNNEDRTNGFIMGKTRQGQEVSFPVMTVSIAVVTNKERKFTTVAEVGEIAAELKDYAKSIPGSIYVVDKRRKALSD